LSNALAKMNGHATPLDRSLPWTPFRDLLGFDPFQNIRSSYGFDYDVTRTEGGYEVGVPVPGYGSGQIDVTYKDGVINVGGKTDRRSFTRSFTVPDDVNPDAIEARVKDGMLTIVLKRHPEAQPKRINVE